MTFRPEEVEAFLQLFDLTKDKIRHFPGCQHLELLKDYNDPCVFSTFSKWENEEALNEYRHSELFKEVWANTKSKFAEKPIAFSSKAYIHVD